MMTLLLKVCFTVLRPDLKSACSSASRTSALAVEDDSEHDLAGMADGTRVLTLLEVAGRP